MEAFLSDEWFEALARAGATLPEVEGASGIVQIVVSGSPQGKVQFIVTVEDGRVTNVEPGKAAEPTAVLTWSHADAEAIFRGELDPDVAYMSGQTKVEGDYATFLLRLRPVFGAAGMAAVREALGA